MTSEVGTGQSAMESKAFKVPQMDCAAEEQLVRLHLGDRDDVHRLAFDLATRTVVVTHSGDSAAIERAMHDLRLGAALIGRGAAGELGADASDERQRSLLIIVLLLNASLFVLELVTGLIAQSMGLVADSLDMLADAIVYGLSLYAVGKALARKKQIARMSGYLQFALAVFGVVEVARRFLGAGDEPSVALMIGVSLVALAGNVASLLVLQRTRSQDAHIRASWIFTTNDVLVNLGVMAAGVLVFVSGSRLPDLVVGAAVFCLVGYGAARILKLSR